MPATRAQHERNIIAAAAPPPELLKIDLGHNLQSPFFGILPAEIRNQIYEQAFGLGELEIFLRREPNRLPARLKTAFRTGRGDDAVVLKGWRWNSWHRRDGRWKRLKALGWLVSCKQA